MCLIYIEETPCKSLSLKLLDRKDEIPYQNGGHTDTQTDTQTDTHTEFVESQGAYAPKNMMNQKQGDFFSSPKQLNIYSLEGVCYQN